MPLPLVLSVLETYREGIIAREETQMGEMADRWGSVEDALQGRMNALAEAIKAKRDAGEAISDAALMRMEHYKRLIAQAETQFDSYSAWAAANIQGEQLALAGLGIDASTAAIGAVYEGAGVAIAAFDILPLEAVASMIGFTSEGAPLLDLLRSRWPDAADGLTQALINAIAAGDNPRVTARNAMEAFGIGLNDILRIARTEQLRSFREANRMAYAASGVVEGYRRLCAKQDRTCLPCLLADGELYDLETPLDEHPNGRCALVPVVKNMPAVSWPLGRDWFESLDADSQRGIMGAGHFDAWQEGSFSLDDITRVQHDSVWGNSLQMRSLKDLLGEEEG